MDIKTKIKVILGAALTPQELQSLKDILVKQETPAPTPVPAPVVLKEAKTKDGQVLSYDGELSEGLAINVVTEAGSTPAPDGTHELEDGTKITTVAGVITKVEKVEAVAVPAVEQIVQQMETKFSAQFKTQEDSFKTQLSAQTEALKKEIEALEVKLQTTAGILNKALTTPVVTEVIENASLEKEKPYEEMTNFEKLKYNERNKK